MQVQAILFDLDDTLLDGSRLPEAIRRTCNDLANTAHLEADALVEANRHASQSYWPHAQDDWTLGRLSGWSLSLEVWRRTLRQFGNEDEALAKHATRLLRKHLSGLIAPFPEVSSVLPWIKRRFRVGVVTNGAPDTQRDHLAFLGMQEHVDAVAISGVLGVAKPDPRIFQMIVEQLDVVPSAVWHVGDDLVTDVAGAKSAGLGAIWLNRAANTPRATDQAPDAEISSLVDLMPLLGSR